MSGAVTGVTVDPKNWLINKAIGPVQDPNLMPSGIQDIPFSGTAYFEVFPNPASDFISWESNDERISEIRIYDISGKMLASSDRKNIFVSWLPSGVYLITAIDKGKNVLYEKKFWVKK
jgi:hypothetical protein